MAPIASRLIAVTLAALLAAGWLSASPQPTRAAGTISLSAIDSAYNQSFNGLATLGTANLMSNATSMGGWELTESGGGARDNEQYAAGTGSASDGDTYSFGTLAALLDRSLGGLRGTALFPIFGAAFTNDTGETIDALDVVYTGEMFRAGVLDRNAADRIEFQLSLDATSLTTGTWTDHDALDFSSPTINTTVGAKDGNASAFRSERAHQIADLAIAPGASFWIRWTDFDISGNDDGLAVDDFSMTPRAADDDAAPEVRATTPADGDEDVAVDANLSVTFSEPVDAAASAFDVTCTESGTHSTVVAGGPTTFTIDPDDDFWQHESCTLTVDDAGVTDTDATDPPDAMTADMTVTFRVANPPPVFAFVAGASCAATGGTFAVRVSDLEMDPADLNLTLTGNTNATLVPDDNVGVTGAANRAIAVAVAARQIGAGVLTFTLSDGVNDVTYDINVQVGNGANDTFTGTPGADLLLGNQGDDSLTGIGGQDVLCGGNGTDVVSGGDGPDALSGDKGSDTLTGGAGADAFSGGHGPDTSTDFDADEGDTSDGS